MPRRQKSAWTAPSIGNKVSAALKVQTGLPARVSTSRGEAGRSAADPTVGRPCDVVSAVYIGYCRPGLLTLRRDTGCDCDCCEVLDFGVSD